MHAVPQSAGFSNPEPCALACPTQHGLLSYSMMGSAAMGLCELAWPGNVLFTCGRIGASMLQGAWLLAVSRMIFLGEGS